MKRTPIATWARSSESYSPGRVGESSNARFVINMIVTFAEDLKKLFPKSAIYVIGTHEVYSATYPVVCLEIPELGLKVYGSCNHSDWSMTVESEQPIDGFEKIAVNGRGRIYLGCFNGFERSQAPVYEGGYMADRRRFSFYAPPPPNDTLRHITMELIKARQG